MEFCIMLRCIIKKLFYPDVAYYYSHFRLGDSISRFKKTSNTTDALALIDNNWKTLNSEFNEQKCNSRSLFFQNQATMKKTNSESVWKTW